MFNAQLADCMIVMEVEGEEFALTEMIQVALKVVYGLSLFTESLKLSFKWPAPSGPGSHDGL